ncbi:MAG: LPS export ABC transporter periplasmic protein LptC [Qingshengfaniella sp.]
MGRFDNAYSRAVATAKLVLPLVALGVISTLFLFSRPAQQSSEMPFPDLTVLDLAREQRLGTPIFSGVTPAGTQITLLAESVRPDAQAEDLVHASALNAQLLTPDGLSYRINAETGEIDRTRLITTFRDNVTIDTSDGYHLNTQVLAVTSDLSRVESLADVRVTGPLGTLRAHRMRLTRNPETGAEARLVFTGGVQLLYTPRS